MGCSQGNWIFAKSDIQVQYGDSEKSTWMGNRSTSQWRSTHSTNQRRPIQKCTWGYSGKDTWTDRSSYLTTEDKADAKTKQPHRLQKSPLSKHYPDSLYHLESAGLLFVEAENFFKEEKIPERTLSMGLLKCHKVQEWGGRHHLVRSCDITNEGNIHSVLLSLMAALLLVSPSASVYT